jgi:hypothetical protein
LPLLKSSVVALAAAFETIVTCVMSDGISGYGAAVLKRIVRDRRQPFSLICFVNAVNGDGLFGTVSRARSTRRRRPR